MGSNEEEKKGGFKVVDHRRFDDSGNERGSEPQQAAKASPQRPSSEPAVEESFIGGSGVDPESEITFASFIMSLATQALMQLGEIPPPPGVDLKPDREGAKQTIDIISIIERKTKGNLDPNEEQLLTEVLHNLRMCYVRKV